jgi:predicted RNase H-like nuclease (RuvC/YqgF family)
VSEIEEIIEGIDQKVRQLVSNNERLEEVLSQKEREIEELKAQIMNLEKEINKEKVIENNINNDSDVNKSKILIDDLLKKIDRSISIISKK